jgi:hypothetical protein
VLVRQITEGPVTVTFAHNYPYAHMGYADRFLAQDTLGSAMDWHRTL